MKYYIVDAFAEKVFEGNPAGVCILNEWLSEELMLKIAIENNLSETAFAVGKGENYDLRWFTPGGEINLCGHATLATSFVITNFIDKNINKLIFKTKSGNLIVNKNKNLFEMDFPSIVPKEFKITDEMIEALGVTPLEAYLNRDLMFVLENENQIQSLTPDFSKLKNLSDGLGVLVTAKGNSVDFVSRTFFPKLNVNEDPVCGSAHTNFIPYWAEKLNKTELIAKQLSKRGGTLYCKINGRRVVISGTAVLYLVADIMV